MDKISKIFVRMEESERDLIYKMPHVRTDKFASEHFIETVPGTIRLNGSKILQGNALSIGSNLVTVGKVVQKEVTENNKKYTIDELGDHIVELWDTTSGDTLETLSFDQRVGTSNKIRRFNFKLEDKIL